VRKDSSPSSSHSRIQPIPLGWPPLVKSTCQLKLQNNIRPRMLRAILNNSPNGGTNL
jgi:hypothetical protein